jgi:hypothetical protein
MPVRTTVEIPKHDARSKALITLEVSQGGYNPLTESVQDALSRLVEVGNVTKITIPTKRGASERRELKASNFGEIKEIIPGLIDQDGIRLNNVITYKETFLQACGFVGGHSLDYQSYPCLFVLTLPSPEPDKFPVRTLMFEKTWILDNPYEFSVEEKDNLQIVQDIELRVGKIREVKI